MASSRLLALATACPETPQFFITVLYRFISSWITFEFPLHIFSFLSPPRRSPRP
ncbi:hypothetical protein MCOR29_011056 [Pyricularia oryzae]|nr:hypothetical protein MCOR29_011056 [Pyricularia oryzae]